MIARFSPPVSRSYSTLKFLEPVITGENLREIRHNYVFFILDFPFSRTSKFSVSRSWRSIERILDYDLWFPGDIYGSL